MVGLGHGALTAEHAARRCWALLRAGMSAEDVLMEEETMLQGMRRNFESLERVHVAHKAAAAAFPAAAGAGAAKEMAPAAAEAAIAAESEAADHAQVLLSSQSTRPPLSCAQLCTMLTAKLVEGGHLSF